MRERDQIGQTLRTPWFLQLRQAEEVLMASAACNSRPYDRRPTNTLENWVQT